MREEFNRAEALANAKRAGTVGLALTIWDGSFAGAARKDAGEEDAARDLLKNALDVAFDEVFDTGGGWERQCAA